MERDNTVLRLEKICKSFGGLQVLLDVDIRLEQEEIVGLIGPNGAGKSTLFNIITSIYKPDRGDIYLRGQKITGTPPHRICHLGISRTFQLVRTFPSMTALQNVMVGSIYGRGYRGKSARTVALEALELVDLAAKKDLVTAHMTVSDRRLLEIARALASQPSIGLLDEPMAV